MNLWPGLVDRLESGLQLGKSLTLISAAAGFGKTTLAVDWIDAVADRRRVAWLSLDEGDNDLARFLQGLVASLQTVAPSLGTAVTAMLRAASLPPLADLLGPLINQITATHQAILLVLDDYHLIADVAVHDAVCFFPAHQPANLHAVIVSRDDPPLPLPRMRARRQMTEIREHDLRFSSAWHALETHDWICAAELVERHAMPMIRSSQVPVLRAWCKAVPEEVDTINLAHAYMAMSEPALAEAAFEETLRLAQDAGSGYSAVTAIFYLVRIAFLRGDLRRAAELCDRGRTMLNRDPAYAALDLPAKRGVEVALSCLLLEQNDLAAAEQALERGLDVLGWATWMEVNGYANLARLCEMRRDAAGVLAARGQDGEAGASICGLRPGVGPALPRAVRGPQCRTQKRSCRMGGTSGNRVEQKPAGARLGTPAMRPGLSNAVGLVPGADHPGRV